MFFESFWLNCTVAVGLILALTFDYVTKFFSYWYVRHVPYKFSVPFFGSDYHRVLGLRNTTEEVNAMYKQHPKEDFVGSVKSRIPDLIVRNPDLIKEVLCTGFESFKSRGLDLDKSRDICLRNNLFYAEGEKWTLLRERLESLLNDVTVPEDCILRSLSGANGNINLQQLLAEVLDNVFIKTFIQEPNDSLKSVVRNLKTELCERNFISKIYNYLMSIFPSVYVLFGLSSVKDYSKKKDHVLKETKFARKIEKLFYYSKKDILRKLNNEPDDTPNEILSSLISEGYVPILNTLTALFYEISKSVQVQTQLRESNAEYLDAVIKETMRLHPSFSVITRKCTKTFKFSESKVLIDKKVTVNIPVEAMHKDTAYFKDSDLFKPERFLNDTLMHSYAFLPFSVGPRKCVGEEISLKIIRSITKEILRNYKVEATEKTPHQLPMADHHFKRVVDGDVWLRFTPL